MGKTYIEYNSTNPLYPIICKYFPLINHKPIAAAIINAGISIIPWGSRDAATNKLLFIIGNAYPIIIPGKIACIANTNLDIHTGFPISNLLTSFKWPEGFAAFYARTYYFAGISACASPRARADLNAPPATISVAADRRKSSTSTIKRSALAFGAFM